MSLSVLYVSAEPVPGQDGGSVHTREVARGLARRGNRVTLLTRREPGQPAVETLEGVEIVRTSLKRGGKTLPILALPRLLRLNPASFDVVMARFAAFGGADGLYAGLAQLPLVLEVNSPQVGEILWRYHAEGTLFADALEAWERAQFSRAAAVITPSKRIVPEEARGRCRLVDWGCDPERFHPPSPAEAGAARRRLDLEDRFVVAFSGSFREWHGVDLLPAVAKALVALRPEAAFLCIGGGPRQAAVKAEAERLGLGTAFRFTGPVPPDEVPSMLAAADVGLAPFQIASYPPFARFGFFYSPLKIFEYMACGLPVLTADCPELAKVVGEGRTGYLVPEGDIGAYAGILAGLAADPGLRTAMGRTARRDAEERFSWKAHVAGVEAVLKEAAQ